MADHTFETALGARTLDDEAVVWIMYRMSTKKGRAGKVVTLWDINVKVSGQGVKVLRFDKQADFDSAWEFLSGVSEQPVPDGPMVY